MYWRWGGALNNFQLPNSPFWCYHGNNPATFVATKYLLKFLTHPHTRHQGSRLSYFFQKVLGQALLPANKAFSNPVVRPTPPQIVYLFGSHAGSASPSLHTRVLWGVRRVYVVRSEQRLREGHDEHAFLSSLIPTSSFLSQLSHDSTYDTYTRIQRFFSGRWTPGRRDSAACSLQKTGNTSFGSKLCEADNLIKVWSLIMGRQRFGKPSGIRRNWRRDASSKVE